MVNQNPLDYRKSEYGALDIFLKRWSPRAFSSKIVEDEKLKKLVDAARFAPSSFNEQPWRFLYSKRGDENWEMYVSFLVEANQVWAKLASHLIVLISKKTFTYNESENTSHLFDSGAALENFALQASEIGLACHGMAGIIKEKISSDLNISDDYSISCMVALGYPGDISTLPEKLQEAEKITNRKSVDEILIEGKFRE